MSFLGNLGGLFHGGGAAKLPPGNGQWSQLANFFPDEAKGAKPAAKGAGQVDVASILAALQGMSGGSPPPQPPPPEWIPMPPPSAMMRDLRNAPRLAQRQLMPAPDWMQPYLWGVR
jgi:hypothetical protein